MPKLSEQQINNIYLRCNAAPMSQLLDLCLDPESGITIDGLRAVHYNKMDQLEQQFNAQAEEIVWAKSQSSIEALSAFIEKCQQGIFSTAHLAQAKDKRKELAAVVEEDDWNATKVSNDINALNAYIKKCTDGTYSDVHLQQAKDAAEFIDWNAAKVSHNPAVMNGFIQKCNIGIYSSQHLNEAKDLLESWENGTIVEEWNSLLTIKDTDTKRNKLNEFIQRYATNPTETAQKYMSKANELMEQLADAEQARIDWIDAKQENTILAYVNFLEQHPYCEYREEAEERIQDMKGDLLNDMKRFPFKYNREDMYGYISSNALTMKDLVDDSCVLTDRGYSHIKKYPHLIDEQRQLPVSRLENPHSEDGNTDVYFFGVSGSGKTCVLAGLMSLTGQLGFRFDPKGPGGGGNYAMELRNYARTSMLPPATDQNYIQVIDAQINDEDGNLHKIALIEMSGEKTAEFAAIENPTSLEDLGAGAAGLLSNDNNKVLFFVIDPTNEKNVQMGHDSSQWVMQSDVLDCVSSLLSKNPDLMKKVVAIHVILTKSDTLGDYVDQNLIQDRLVEQGYSAVLQSIKAICQKYDINKQTGFQVGLYPFCVGKFMPGDVYTFDETDSLKILRVIQKNTIIERPTDGFIDSLRKWFNS
jgi:hypothetical protein